MTEMQIQKLQVAYLEPAAVLLKQDWLLHAEKTRSYDLDLIENRNVVEWLQSRVLDENRFQCLVAIVDDQVAGVLLYREVEQMTIAPRAKSIKIEDVIIEESQRGNGLAKALIEMVESNALKSGITQIEGDVYEFNQPSKNLFESLGYKPEYASYMKILDKPEPNSREHSNTQLNIVKAKLYTDGGSRGNPGPSAGGFVILDMDNNVVKSNGKYLGITTNNQAEYHSLKGGVEMAIAMGIRELDVYMDSLLVINQMKGIFKIKNRDLWPIHDAIKKLLPHFKKVNFSHVPRELNKLADAVVNETLDAQK